MTAEYLFVYGTLRTTEGHPMHNYLRGLCDFIGPATVQGYTVELDGYPGFIPSGNADEQVNGELFRIHENKSEELFEVLDRYEGCHPDDPEPHEYFRHRQDVKLLSVEGNEEYEAWIYIYNE